MIPVSKAMTLCTGKKNKYSNEIVVTEVYGVCGEEDHDICSGVGFQYWTRALNQARRVRLGK